MKKKGTAGSFLWQRWSDLFECHIALEECRGEPQRKQGEGLFLNSVYLFPIIRNKALPLGTIWFLMRTCHTHSPAECCCTISKHLLYICLEQRTETTQEHNSVQLYGAHSSFTGFKLGFQLHNWTLNISWEVVWQASSRNPFRVQWLSVHRTCHWCTTCHYCKVSFSHLQ